MSELNLGAIEDIVKQKAAKIAAEKAQEMCDTMNNYRSNEFTRELPLIGRSDLYEKLNQVKAVVTKKDDFTYSIEMDMKSLSEDERELYSFYQKNARLLSK